MQESTVGLIIPHNIIGSLNNSLTTTEDGRRLFEINDMFISDDAVENLDKVMVNQLEIEDHEELVVNEEVGHEDVDFVQQILNLTFEGIECSSIGIHSFIKELYTITQEYVSNKEHEGLQSDLEFINSMYFILTYNVTTEPLRVLESLSKFYTNAITHALEYALISQS